MKSVQGYLADDGTFFEWEASAKKHDAEMAIRAYCVTHTSNGEKITNEDEWNGTHCIDAEKVLSVIEALADQIMEYLNANRETQAFEKRNLVEERTQDAPSSKAQDDQADNIWTTEDIKTVLEQSVDGLKPVPYVGRGTQPEGIHKKR